MNSRHELRVEMIPIDQITVVNPRSRGMAKFRQIVESISKLGLKRPITVARRERKNGGAQYDLVCGQGRLEAFQALGQNEVQAVVVDVTKEELLLMSLTENLARRTRSAAELMQSIAALKDAGHSFTAIAEKTDLNLNYVKGVLRLLGKGEDRLLRAVEHGQIPISIAVTIATSEDADVQRALTDAYEKNLLRGKALIRARRLIEERHAHGKSSRKRDRRKSPEADSAKLLETYKQEASKERLLIKQARMCESRLMFLVSALRQLLQDDEFVRLLRDHGLDKLPQYLADHIYADAKS